MVEIYENQDIGFRRRADVKDNGTVIFEPARHLPYAVIRGNVTYSRRLIRNAKGEEVISEGYVLTSSEVKEGDLLYIDGREWMVQKSHAEKGLMGETLHWEASL